MILNNVDPKYVTHLAKRQIEKTKMEQENFLNGLAEQYKTKKSLFKTEVLSREDAIKRALTPTNDFWHGAYHNQWVYSSFTNKLSQLENLINLMNTVEFREMKVSLTNEDLTLLGLI